MSQTEQTTINDEDDNSKKIANATSASTATKIATDHNKDCNGGTISAAILHNVEQRTRSAGSVTVGEDDGSQATATNVDESGDEYSSQQSSATNDPGKMFVGGLSWQTTAEGLRDYFSKFGEVNECMVMRDPTTKRARGFGFITFADPNTVYKVLKQEIHELDGKKIDPKIAFPKKAQPKMVVKTKKVFIGGLSSNSTLDDIKNYFQQFGKIEDAMLMYDKATQRHRGFGFITFDSDEVSDKVCEIHFHEINGKMVECKKAQPKEVMLPVQMNKTRAAAARNLYGLAPEQLLAYASYMPRLPYAPMGSPAGVLYPGVFNGFSPQSAAAAFGISSGRSSVSNSGPLSSTSSGLVNPRDLAAAQAIAQQQAVYEAAIAYVSMGGGAGEFLHHHPGNHHHQASGGSHHQLIHQQHQSPAISAHPHHHLTAHNSAHQAATIQSQHLHHQNAAAMAMATMQHHQPPPNMAASSYGKM